MEEVTADIRARLAKYPGFQFNVKQHISEHIEDVLSGSLATISVRVYGEDTAFFGKAVSTVLEGQRQHDLFVRYSPEAARRPGSHPPHADRHPGRGKGASGNAG